MFKDIINNLAAHPPLIHSITNYVTVNDCANILLACGASPIMTDDEAEVEEITSLCSGLVINIGTLNKKTIAAMLKAGKKAASLGHLIVLDPVGAGASTLRTDTTFKLLEEVPFSVIRGNISEIKTVALGSGTTKGVDADVSDKITEENISEAIAFVRELSAKTGAVIAVTGAIDIVSDSQKTYIIRNGHPLMSKLTGSGCMLTELIAAYGAANPNRLLEATAAAVCAMGLAGELAYSKMIKTEGGTSTYRTLLIDAVSNLTADVLNEGAKIESK